MTEFYQTVMGREFYDRTVPRLVAALEKIAENKPKTPWEDNEVQFARLLCELVANWDNDTSAKQTIRAVADSMDLTVDEVNALFDRADSVWEESKRRVAKGKGT